MITRDFPHGRDSVWALLTRPERLELWAPYTADRDLSQVGRCVLTMLGDGNAPDVEIPSVVLVADSPELLEYSWASDMLAWHIATIGSGSRLTLHQTLADETMASANAAGWHLCLDVASAVLEGSKVAPIRGMDAMKHGWTDLNERYAVAFGVKPSRVG
ncbi:MAG TPA: SRPBCC domain-containing protein [Galbitalea sp.]|nr:SRPBCC domain-containing protein [Galbitalea sp.]